MVYSPYVIPWFIVWCHYANADSMEDRNNARTIDLNNYTINRNSYTINEDYTIKPAPYKEVTNSAIKGTIRKELRDLTVQELTEYKKAVNMLREHGIIDDLAILHTACETYAHNSTRFLPWHRAFLLYFERIIKTVTNKKISVPYWDWSIDAHAPTQSFALQHVWPINDTNHCFLVNFPSTHCVKRSPFIDAFYSTAQVKRMLKLPFSKFSTSFEIVPHAIVHLNVGGTDGDMAMLYSCNDPIFFQHHSYIDYLWSVQQVKGGNWYDGDFDEVMFPFDMRVRDVWKSMVVYKPYVIDYMDDSGRSGGGGLTGKSGRMNVNKDGIVKINSMNGNKGVVNREDKGDVLNRGDKNRMINRMDIKEDKNRRDIKEDKKRVLNNELNIRNINRNDNKTGNTINDTANIKNGKNVTTTNRKSILKNNNEKNNKHVIKKKVHFNDTENVTRVENQKISRDTHNSINYRSSIARIPDFYIKRHKYSKRRTRLTERYLNDNMSLLDRILF